MAARLDSGLRRNDGAVDLLPIFIVMTAPSHVDLAGDGGGDPDL